LITSYSLSNYLPLLPRDKCETFLINERFIGRVGCENFGTDTFRSLLLLMTYVPRVALQETEFRQSK